MIFSVITQEGLKISTLNNTIYQFSDNLTFQFVRDPKFNDYTLAAYINYSDKVYSLEIKNEDTFEIDSRFLNEKKEFLLSFSLTNGEEIIHLGTINYRVKDAFGSTTSPLPGQKEVWTALVEQEVDDYFLKNYQSQLDDFNQKYEEIKKIASGGGGGSNVTVDNVLSSTSTNPVQNKVIKSELDKKAAKNEIPTELSSLKDDKDHRLTSDDEKEAWNAKSDFSGNYNDLNGKPTIPTNLSSLNEDENHMTVTANEKKKWDNKSDFDGDFNSLKNKPEIPNAVIVDAELSETSSNAIQNGVVAKGLNKKANLTDLGINKYSKSETDATVTLENGSWTVFPTMTSLNVSMGEVDENKAFICGFQFTSRDTATSLTMNNCTLTSNSDTVESNKTYEVNILDGSAIVREI